MLSLFNILFLSFPSFPLFPSFLLFLLLSQYLIYQFFLSYPLSQIFQAGKKTSKSVKDYNGPREQLGIVDHALQLLEASGIPIKIPQLTSQKALDSSCGPSSGGSGGESKICVIVFVPHIYDSDVKSRNQYIDTIADVAKSFRGTPISFFWSEGGAQETLESSLQINNAYPTLAVLSVEKKVFAVQKVSWSAKNAKAFLNGVISGR